MNEQKFWEIVEKINWKTIAEQNHDVDKIKTTIMREYSRATMTDFRKIKHAKAAQLQKTIEKYNDTHKTTIPCYDDSGSDLINHVIGLGKDYFNKALAKPSILKTLEYVESFSYIIPYVSDYDKLQPGYFKNRPVKQFKEEILSFLTTHKFTPVYADELDFLTTVVKKLEVDDFATLPEPAIVRGYWNTIRDKIQNTEGKLAELQEIDTLLGDYEWMLSNIVHDAKSLA